MAKPTPSAKEVSKVLEESVLEGAVKKPGARYIISYDVKATGDSDQDEIYKTFKEELEEIGAEPVLLSQWAVRRTTTASQLVDRMLLNLTARQRRLVRLLVTCLDSTDWAGHRLMFDPDEL